MIVIDCAIHIQMDPWYLKYHEILRHSKILKLNWKNKFNEICLRKIVKEFGMLFCQSTSLMAIIVAPWYFFDLTVFYEITLFWDLFCYHCCKLCIQSKVHETSLAYSSPQITTMIVGCSRIISFLSRVLIKNRADLSAESEFSASGFTFFAFLLLLFGSDRSPRC